MQRHLWHKSLKIWTQKISDKYCLLLGLQNESKSIKIWKKKKLYKNCLFSGLHNESPAQIKIELLTTSKEHINQVCYLGLSRSMKTYFDHKNIQETKGINQMSYLGLSQKNTGHGGYQSESIQAMQYQINDLSVWSVNHTNETLSCSQHSKGRPISKRFALRSWRMRCSDMNEWFFVIKPSRLRLTRYSDHHSTHHNEGPATIQPRKRATKLKFWVKC